MASPRQLAASGAAGDLRQQLERALGGAEVGEAEPDVGGDHADERDARKVVPLGDHLRADEDVDLPAANRDSSAAIAPRLRIVSRSTRATRAPGNERDDLRLDPLGAEADLLEERAGALRARPSAAPPSGCSSGSARARRRVHRQRDAAVRALERRAALPAEDDGREAAPVQQHDRLLAAFEAGAERLAQRAAQDDVRPRGGELLAHVDDRARAAIGRSSTRRSRAMSGRSGRSARCDSSRATASPSRARRARPPARPRTTATSRPW